MSFQEPTAAEAQLLLGSMFLPRPVLQAVRGAARAGGAAADDAVVPAPRTGSADTFTGVVVQRVHSDA